MQRSVPGFVLLLLPYLVAVSTLAATHKTQQPSEASTAGGAKKLTVIFAVEGGDHEPLGKDILGIYDQASMVPATNEIDATMRAELESIARTAATTTNLLANVLADFHTTGRVYSNTITQLDGSNDLTDESRRELQASRNNLGRKLVGMSNQYRNLNRELDALRDAQYRLLDQRASEYFASIRRLPAVASFSVLPNGHKTVRLTGKRQLFLAARALRFKPEGRGLISHFWLMDLNDLKPGQSTLILNAENSLRRSFSELVLTEQFTNLPAPPKLPAALLTGDAPPKRRAPVFRLGEHREGSYPEPTYPLEAQRRKLDGTVELFVEVNTDGVPSTVEVESSSGHQVLDQTVVDQVRRRWRWPKADEPRQYIVPFIFKLD